MTNRLNQNHIPENKEDSDPINIQTPTKVGTEVASALVLAFAGALEDKDLKPFEIMQALVEFVVSTVRGIEQTGKAPDSFRTVLLRNIELNFDYKVAKDQGIDLSELLLMGIKREFGETDKHSEGEV